ncbi:MAG: protein-glutamate O-methyltransferase CheR [Hyphomicrobiaceae bacterium]|nr:protein-glutamate O-methyltransferase CheR [Hyphomicrobiaceae bacterium]
MTPAEFDFLRNMLKTRSGLVLGEEKRYLLESRLMPVAREAGLESLGDLAKAVMVAGAESLRTKVTQAMTINESFFYRDKTPFENFRDIMVPAMLESQRSATRKLRIWCAAASTGQEPYSLAIEIKELEEQFRGWSTDIIGTDLSEEVLEKARAGLYSQFEVQRGLPIQLLVKYFKQTGSMWQIDSAIRSMVDYKHFNLLDDYSSLGMFDIIFCRNVLIYFDPETKQDMLARMAKRLQPDGYLVLGAAETVIGISSEFKPVADARGLYELSTASQAATGAPAVAEPAKPAPAATAASIAAAGIAKPA